MSLELLGVTYLPEIKHDGRTWRPGMRVQWKGKNPTDDGFLRHRKKGDRGVIHDDGSGRPMWSEASGRYRGDWTRVRWDEHRATPMDYARLHGADVDDVRLDDLALVEEAAPDRTERPVRDGQAPAADRPPLPPVRKPSNGAEAPMSRPAAPFFVPARPTTQDRSRAVLWAGCLAMLAAGLVAAMRAV